MDRYLPILVRVLGQCGLSRCCLFLKKYILNVLDYQVLGQLPRVIDNGKKGDKHEFKDASGMIKNRIFSLQNLSFKWSLYRQHENGQE